MGIRLSDHFTYKKLLRFVLPSIAMMVFISVYGVVDGFFVSNFAGKTSFAAINLVMPFVMLLGGIGFMVGTGGTALVSKVLGEGDREKANRYFSMMVFLTLLLGVLLTAVGIAAMEPVARFLGATDAMIADSVLYGRIVVGFTTAFMLQNVFQSFLIAAEKPKLGLYATVAAGVTNMALDALFIAGFGWGVEGAALATVISQCISCLWVLLFLRGEKTILRLKKENMRLEAEVILPCLALGLAAFIMQSSESIISVSFNTSLLKYGGDIAVGAMTILSSINMFAMLPLQGLGQGAQPIVSYNYGAKDAGRVRGAFKLLLRSSLIYAGALWLIIMLFPQAFTGLFTPNAELAAFTQAAMRRYFAVMFMFGIQVACQMTFTAIGSARSSIAVAVVRKFVLLLPLIYLMPALFPADKAMAVYLAEPAADLIAVTFTAILFSVQFKKAIEKLPNS